MPFLFATEYVQLRQFKVFFTLSHIYYRHVLVFHAAGISINSITFMHTNIGRIFQNVISTLELRTVSWKTE